MMQPIKAAHGNCAIDKVVDIFEAHGVTAAVKAYMCRWCNYIQVHKSRMTAHLMEHKQNELDPNRNRNIQSVTLLPDLEALTWSIIASPSASVDFKFVPDTSRFVCGIENCGIELVSSSEFRGHFQQNHSTQTAFTCPHCGKMIEKKNRHLVTEIFQHFQLHSGHLYKCTVCRTVTGHEYDMLQHMARYHYCEKKIHWPGTNGSQELYVKFQYLYSHSQGGDELEKQECTIWFACNVCDKRFEYSNEANEHFVNEHKSYYIDLEAIKMVKRTTIDGITSFYLHDFDALF